jgi:predicted RNase H-like nuclease (RuvC/YqgF family)
MYAARSQFTAIKNARESLTTEDITNLKREKQNLLRERTLLKAKLSRYASFNRHSKPPGRNQQIANSLEREVHKLEQLTAAKRAEIAQLIYSDRAAVITELQEESKMLHLELMRLKKAKQESELDLREIASQYEQACQKYSPAVLTRQHAQIATLEQMIAAQKEKNETLQSKVNSLKAEQEGQERQAEAEKVQQKIDQLKAKIRREQQEISALDKQMEEMRQEHNNEMQRLQAQV